MNRRPILPDLASAVEWLRDIWSERETPLRLHTPDHEGFGLMFAPNFARRLDARPDDTAQVTTQRTCSHHRLEGRSVYQCPDCAGAGHYDVTAEAFRYPTWRAMVRLHAQNVTAHDIVLTFVINAFVVSDMPLLGIPESALLRAIRQLHSRYTKGPDRVAWTERSESQQRSDVEGRLQISYAVAATA